MVDVILSPSFKLSEFTRSATAIARGLDNTPSLEAIGCLQQLCLHVLQPLRNAFGVPVVIGSGYRSPSVNKAVGGVSNSQHMDGMACDIHIRTEEEGNAWFEWLKYSVPFDQLIRERNTAASKSWWIHVSYRPDGKNRGQIIENLIKNK